MPELTPRWTLPALIAFYEANGRMPFPIAGAAGEEDGDDDAGGGDGDGKGTQDTDDRAELKTALQKERDRAKAAERDLKKLQARLNDLDGRDKTDVERLTKERDELKTALEEREARVRQQTARTQALDAARELNAVSTKAVYALIRDDIEFDDDGEPTNIERLIAKAKKDEPSLFRASTGSGDGGKGGDAPKDANERINQLIRQAAGR